MSRWLKSVNTLLETLDGQVEDVVEADDDDDVDESVLLGDEEFESDDYDSDDAESEYESEELESEFEEEQVVWEAQKDEQTRDGNDPLFDQTEVQPFEEQSADATVTPLPEAQKPPAIVKADETPPEAIAPIIPEPSSRRTLEDPNEGFGATDDLDAGKATETKVTAARPPPPPPLELRTTEQQELVGERNKSPRESYPPPPPPMQVDSRFTAVASALAKEPSPPPPPTQGDKAQATVRPDAAVTRKASQLPAAPLSGMSSVESPPASGYASAPNMSAGTNSQGGGNTTSSSVMQQQLKRSNRELKKVQSEARQLRKHVMQLNTQLETAEAEMAAQRQELQRAAERMEKDRARNNEEREDLLDDHEEEIESMKEHYEKLLAEQKDRYEEQVEDLQDRVAAEEEKRMQEGGDWTHELEESVEREREALKRLTELKEENAALQSKSTKLEAQQNALQKKLESSAQNFQTASQREREAEDKLDAALSLHSRQMSQRQSRESELERMVADLGAALTVARQKETRSSQETCAGVQADVGYRKKYELAVDELETTKVQLSMESQRCEALRQELHEITAERTEETFATQAKQQQHDREIADLTANVARLQANLRERKKTPSAPGETTGEFTSPSDGNDRQSREVYEQREKVASLSEQLIRLQEKNDRSKSEVLALKSRLQASNARAESAEQALASVSTPATTSQLYEAEGGGAPYGSTMRRRVKSGRGSRTPASVRSIRSALNMNPGRVSDGAEPIVATMDAIDSFVVETGSFMRHEPLARLAFLMYLVILHLWAFCLVLFHAQSFEKEHGDFGSLSDSGGLPGEAGHP